jgi:hypothetical protein
LGPAIHDRFDASDFAGGPREANDVTKTVTHQPLDDAGPDEARGPGDQYPIIRANSVKLVWGQR